MYLNLVNSLEYGKNGFRRGIDYRESRPKVLRRVQPVQKCGDESSFSARRHFYGQQLCHGQLLWEMPFKQFKAITLALDFANAANHWEKMTEENGCIFCRLDWSDVEKNIGEQRFDFVQEVQDFVINIAEKNDNFSQIYFGTHVIKSSWNFVMFSGISVLGNLHFL